MKANEGGADRAVRVVLGIVALVAAFVWLDVMDAAAYGIVAAAVGAVLLLTGLVGFCPAYRVLGLRTCKLQAE